MTRLLAVVMSGGLVGCGDGSKPVPQAPADPYIRVREGVGAGVGPVGGARTREYEGPASQAPALARPKPAPGK